jgi:hypothetical protein
MQSTSTHHGNVLVAVTSPRILLFSLSTLKHVKGITKSVLGYTEEKSMESSSLETWNVLHVASNQKEGFHPFFFILFLVIWHWQKMRNVL